MRFLVSRASPFVHHAVWLVFTVPSAFNCPCSTGYLLPGLADYVISKVCLTVVSASTSLVWYFSPFVWANPVPWRFIEPLETRYGFERSMPLSSPRRAAMSTTHHLVGIIQCRVWLSCFTKHFSPGLIITVSLEGWVTAISASTSPLFAAQSHFGSSLALYLLSWFDTLLIKCAIGEIRRFMSYLERCRLKCY